jgi:hypothetical protein
MIKKGDIDFDEASRCWRANKKYMGGGVFSYKCQYFSEKTKKYCSNKLVKQHIYCKYHLKKLTINN